MKKINNQKHYLINAKVECGHSDIIELGPSLSSSNIQNIKDNTLLDIVNKKNIYQLCLTPYNRKKVDGFIKKKTEICSLR